MIFEVQSGDKTYELDAPDQASAMKAVQGLIASVTGGKGDRQAMAAGAVPHAMPPETVQGGPPPSVASDIADSAASRIQAGGLDILGIGGDLVSLANNAADAISRPLVGGMRWLMGKPQLTPQEQDQVRQKRDAQGTPLGFLPTSQDVKKWIGFEAYQPQTETGKTFDKWGGGAIELLTSLAATGGSGLIKKGLQEGAAAALKQGTGDVLKYAVAPSVASEAAGEATKGTALEPWARLGAAILTGGAAGAKRGAVTGAQSIDEWRAAAKQAYADMKTIGIGVKPAAFDRAVSDIEQIANSAGFHAKLPGHAAVKVVLDDLNAAKGMALSYEELDRFHRVAMSAANSIEPDARRIGGIIAGKIDDFMETLKPTDLMAGVNPKAAFNTLIKGREAWRRMRNGERIANLIAQAKDRVGANYTAAGMQTALRQNFRSFKWTGKKTLTREFNRLGQDEKILVNSIIGGATLENALRLVGKFNFHGSGNAVFSGGAGYMLGGPIGAVALPIIGELSRAASAAMTISKANRIGEIVRGGKFTPGRWSGPPNAIFYGTAAQNAAGQSK